MSTENKQIVGDKKAVAINYTLYLDDGSVADTTYPNEEFEIEKETPLYFLCGYGNIIPGLEKALNGLAVGDKKVVEIEPEEAYGEISDDAFQEVPKNVFPEDYEIEVGMPFALMDEDDNYIPAIVHEIHDDFIVVDMNHPLAGEKLKFEVEIMDIRDASAEEIAHGHIHGEHGHHH
ncbi:MAG: peptidylprolyl isomerase [Candidatus Sericytochromatia bacterium]